MGVLSASSLFMKLGELAMGLSSSDGNVPDPGVCREEEVLALLLLSNPAAAMVAEDIAVAAIVGCRRLRE